MTITASIEEARCESCGNWTSCHHLVDGRFICDICLPSNMSAVYTTPDSVEPEPLVKDKVYNLAVPNLASDTQHLIAKECIDLARWLLSENERHSNNLLNPHRVLSQADPLERINTIVDEKLSTLVANPNDDKADRSLIGYLIMRRIAKRGDLR